MYICSWFKEMMLILGRLSPRVLIVWLLHEILNDWKIPFLAPIEGRSYTVLSARLRKQRPGYRHLWSSFLSLYLHPSFLLPFFPHQIWSRDSDFSSPWRSKISLAMFMGILDTNLCLRQENHVQSHTLNICKLNAFLSSLPFPWVRMIPRSQARTHTWHHWKTN